LFQTIKSCNFKINNEKEIQNILIQAHSLILEKEGRETMNNEEKLFYLTVEKARKCGLEKKYQNAIQHYHEAIKMLDDQDPNCLILRIELGWAFYESQNYSDAIIQFQDAVKRKNIDNQQKFDCLRLIGFSYLMLGNNKNAIDALMESQIIEVPEKMKRFVYFELGKLLFHANQILQAEKFLTKANALFDRSESEYQSTLAYFLGFVAFLQQKLSSASRLFEKVLKTSNNPKTRAAGFFGLAQLHYYNKDYTTLIDFCEKILRLDPTFDDKETLAYFMSTAYLKLKMWEPLKTYFNELETNYPNGRYARDYPKFKEALHKSHF
jgi:tetratricopeptide (TPR) repeat protein